MHPKEPPRLNLAQLPTPLVELKNLARELGAAKILMKRDDLTVHGFRSTFRDWAAERTGYPREVVEMALAHAVENKVEAAYRRGTALKKRELLMQAWAQFCEADPAETRANVTQLRA